MTAESVTFLCGSYKDLAAADADFQGLQASGASGGAPKLGTVVLGKRDTGQVTIYRCDPPLDDHQGVGLAAGLAIALLPAVGLDAAEWDRTSSARRSVVAGHVVTQTSRAALEELGHRVDAAPAVLLVARGPSAEDSARLRMTHAEDIVEQVVPLDLRALEARLEQLSATLDNDR